MSDAAFITGLADLLKRAEVAHLAYQEEHGPTDWPQWYATHMTHALGEENFRELDVLSALLAASAAHGVHEELNGGEYDTEWAQWYAEHMAARLSREWYLQQAADESIDF